MLTGGPIYFEIARHLVNSQSYRKRVGHVLSVACFLVTTVGHMAKTLPLAENVSVHP